jgi:hypothetical protein
MPQASLPLWLTVLQLREGLVICCGVVDAVVLPIPSSPY